MLSPIDHKYHLFVSEMDGPSSSSPSTRALLPASPDSSQFSSTCSSAPQVFEALTHGANLAFCVQRASMRRAFTTALFAFHLAAGRCGLNVWQTMSTIVDTVSTTASAAGPYTRVGVVIPKEAHNAYYAYDGASQTHLIYHIGNADAGDTPPIWTNCTNGTTPGPVLPHRVPLSTILCRETGYSTGARVRASRYWIR